MRIWDPAHDQEEVHAGGADAMSAPDRCAATSTRRRPRRKAALLAALGVGVVAVGLLVVLATSRSPSTLDASSPLLGKAAPPISGTTLTGERFSLAALRGHYVVIDFFASWCVPCIREEPELETFVMENRRPGGARLVGVMFNDSVANVRGFLGVAISLYPVLADSSANIAISYGVDNPPTKFLVDPDGRVVAKIVGGVTVAGLESLIAEAQATGH